MGARAGITTHVGIIVHGSYSIGSYSIGLTFCDCERGPWGPSLGIVVIGDLPFKQYNVKPTIWVILKSFEVHTDTLNT